MIVMMMVSVLMALLPTLLGAFLLAHGLAGRNMCLDPECRACGHDLRAVGGSADTCPQCGADLTRRSAVRARRPRPRPAWTITGVLIVLLPMAFIVGPELARWWQSPKRQSTAALLNAYASGNAEAPHVHELRRRLTLNELDAATTQQLVRGFLAARAHGTAATSHPDGSFVQPLLMSDHVSSADVAKIIDAVLGTPTLAMTTAAESGEMISFEVEFAAAGPSAQCVTCIDRVRLDGREIQAVDPFSREVTLTARGGFPLEGGITLPQDLAPGERSLEVDIAWTIPPPDDGFGHNPGLADDWPEDWHLQRATLHRTLVCQPR